jgi:dTDP-4-amino-4,6-dideoxygalactose transaminase
LIRQAFVRIREVPFYRLRLNQGEINKVVETLRSGWLTTGKTAHEFEQEFADYVGANHALAVNSCTAALHLSLLASGIGSGHEVITTPYTFVATTETIIQTGAKVVFVDTERDSFNIDLNQIPAAITERTGAIVPVHIAGLPIDLRKIESLRRKYKLTVIHDAAHALGATHTGKPVGSTADFSCFSFYATKNLTTGEGGMVVTNSRRHYDNLRVLSLHGMSRDAWKRYSGRGSWKYQILQLGYKYNLSDINAAIGLMQLRRFEQIQKQRRRLAEMYHHYLAEIDELILPFEPDGATHAWHLYIVKLRHGGEQRRNEVIEKLRSLGVGTSVHFIPLYLQPYYKKHYHYTRRDLPNSYAHYKSVITLPFYVDLKEDEIKYVAECFKKLFAWKSRIVR